MDGSTMPSAWIDIGALEDIPLRGGRRVILEGTEIGVLRTGANSVYAIDNACPHKRGPLSEGIVHDTGVTCPLHNLVIDLPTGKARAPDEGCVKRYPVEVIDGRIRIRTGS